MMTRTGRLTAAIAMVGACVLGSAAVALPTRLGAEFQANSLTTGHQRGPAVAATAAGAFVVVWASRYQDGDLYGVFGRQFDSSGAAQASEFQVNTYTPGSQSVPAVGVENDGDFVVVWQSANKDGSSGGVFGQRFSSAGARQGGEFQVNSATVGSQTTPAVAGSGSGSFVVVWRLAGTYVTDGIFGRRYDSDGNAQGPDFIVSQIAGEETFPTVGMDSNEGFVVVHVTPDGHGTGLVLERFDSSGASLGGGFVNTVTSGHQSEPSVAVAGDGGFVVTWSSGDLFGVESRVAGQLFGAAGAMQATEFQVSDSATTFESGSSVARRKSGEFVVTWTSYDEGAGNRDVLAREFIASGVLMTAPFQVNTYSVESQYQPAVAVAGDGDFVIAWESTPAQDGSDTGVFGQRFASAIALTSIDVDGNGVADPLTDGLLVVRYLFGFRGATLIANAVAGDCMRCTAPEIEAFIGALTP